MCFGSIIDLTSRSDRRRQEACQEGTRSLFHDLLEFVYGAPAAAGRICSEPTDLMPRDRRTHAIAAVESTDPSQHFKTDFAPRTRGVWVLAKGWHDFASK